MRVNELAGKVWRKVDAGDRGPDVLVVFDILGLGLWSDSHIPTSSGRRDFYVDLLPADELAVGDFLRRIAYDAHDTVLHGQLLRRRAETRSGEFEQLLARHGSSLPQLRPSSFNGSTAGRDALIDHLRSVQAGHFDPIERNVELLGDDLCQRGFDAGSQVDLAAKDGNRAVFADGEPGIELRWIRLSSRFICRLGKKR